MTWTDEGPRRRFSQHEPRAETKTNAGAGQTSILKSIESKHQSDAPAGCPYDLTLLFARQEVTNQFEIIHCPFLVQYRTLESGPRIVTNQKGPAKQNKYERDADSSRTS
jgi:hypothetical protein